MNFPGYCGRFLLPQLNFTPLIIKNPVHSSELKELPVYWMTKKGILGTNDPPALFPDFLVLKAYSTVCFLQGHYLWC